MNLVCKQPWASATSCFYWMWLVHSNPGNSLFGRFPLAWCLTRPSAWQMALNGHIANQLVTFNFKRLSRQCVPYTSMCFVVKAPALRNSTHLTCNEFARALWCIGHVRTHVCTCEELRFLCIIAYLCLCLCLPVRVRVIVVVWLKCVLSASRHVMPLVAIALLLEVPCMIGGSSPFGVNV